MVAALGRVDADSRRREPAPAQASRGFLIFARALLVAAVLIVFGRSLGFPFLRWDDPTAVTENPLLHPPSWKSLAAIWSAPWSGLYIPASFSAYWIEMRISQLFGGEGVADPRIFHAGLLLLHAGCALLVFRILRRLVPDARAALLGALVFAIHPLQVESAVWITETRGVLASLCGLAAIDFYLDGAARREGPSFLRHHVPSTLFFVLALLAKPTAVAIPLVVFLLDRFQLRRPLARIAPLLGLWLGIVLLVVVLTRSQQGGLSIHYVTPLAARPIVALDALSFYLVKLGWPTGLAADYGRKPAWLLEQSSYWLHALPAPAIALALAFLPERRTWLLALSMFAAALSPVLGFLAFDFQAISTVADRYVHLAMLAPAFASAVLLARARRPWALAAASMLVAGLSALSIVEVGRWRDTETLFRRTLEINPRSHIACVHIGVACEEAGQKREAAGWYQRALELEPGYPVAGGNLGRLMLDAGQIDAGIELLRDTVRRNPDYPYAAQQLAIALARRGSAASGAAKQRDFKEAEAVLRDLLKIQSGFPGAHLTLGQILLSEDRFREALEEFAATLELSERSAEAHRGLSQCYAQLGQRDLADQHARAAAALGGR